jgi:hypothetical protein
MINVHICECKKNYDKITKHPCLAAFTHFGEDVLNALLYFLPGYPFPCCLGSFVSNKILLQGSSSYGCWAYSVFALEHAGFFVSLYSKGQVVMTKKFNEKCSQNHTNTHTHTHTHTRKSQKESERMVSVQSCGVSHTVWGGAPCFFRRQKWLHQFSPIPWAVTTLWK